MPRPHSERRSKWPAVVLAIVFLLPVVYVLSIGPAFWLCLTGRLSTSTLNTVYAPVLKIRKSSETSKKVVDDYLWLFTPDDLGSSPQAPTGQRYSVQASLLKNFCRPDA